MEVSGILHLDDQNGIGCRAGQQIMQTLTEQLLEAGLGDRVLTDLQLSRLIEGSSQRRYHLVNRAMKAGELIRVRRGLYILADKYRSYPCHPFVLAQMLEPGSYVSLETALSFHGWIPEAVYTTASITPGRKEKKVNHEQEGLFSFYPLAIERGFFLELVERNHVHQQPFLVADPLRALMDLVSLKKIEWQGLSLLEQGMRIDQDYLKSISAADLQTLMHVYKHSRAQHFLSELGIELGLQSRLKQAWS
jgi:predicted transcriptional regulator of viral defense system